MDVGWFSCSWTIRRHCDGTSQARFWLLLEIQVHVAIRRRKHVFYPEAGDWRTKKKNVASNLQEFLFYSLATVSAVPPQFLKKPSNAYAHEAADVMFECEATGSPAPTIKWVKNGDTLFPSDYFRILVSLQLLSDRVSDSIKAVKWEVISRTALIRNERRCVIADEFDELALRVVFAERAESAGAGPGEDRRGLLSVSSWERSGQRTGQRSAHHSRPRYVSR